MLQVLDLRGLCHCIYTPLFHFSVAWPACCDRLGHKICFVAIAFSDDATRYFVNTHAFPSQLNGLVYIIAEVVVRIIFSVLSHFQLLTLTSCLISDGRTIGDYIWRHYRLPDLPSWSPHQCYQAGAQVSPRQPMDQHLRGINNCHKLLFLH